MPAMLGAVIIPLERRGGAPPVARQVVAYLRRAIDAGPPRRGRAAAADPRPRARSGREPRDRRRRVPPARGARPDGVRRGARHVRPPRRRRAARRAVDGARGARSPSSLSRTADGGRPRFPSSTTTRPPVRSGSSAWCPIPALYPLDAVPAGDRGDAARGGQRALLDYGDPRGHDGAPPGPGGAARARRDRGGRRRHRRDRRVDPGARDRGARLLRSRRRRRGRVADLSRPARHAHVARAARAAGAARRRRSRSRRARRTLLARGGVRLVCTMPTFQNPTGITTDVEHRRRLLAIAARHGVPVLEDDFQHDLRGTGRPAPPLRALDRSGQVIHVGTFSKALFPGPRVGWLVASAGQRARGDGAEARHGPDVEPAGAGGAGALLPGRRLRPPPAPGHARARAAPRARRGGARAPPARGLVVHAARRAAWPSGSRCRTRSTRWRCCRPPRSAASSTPRARSSTPTAGARRRSGSPSAPPAPTPSSAASARSARPRAAR